MKNSISLDDLGDVLSRKDLMSVLKIGRNSAYEVLATGRIRSVRVGTSYRIPKKAVRKFLDPAPANARA